MRPTYFLQQRCRSLEGIPDVGDLPSLDIHPYFSLIAMKKSLTELQERLDDVFKRELATISDISETAFDCFHQWDGDVFTYSDQGV